jgi:hypothetical protein
MTDRRRLGHRINYPEHGIPLDCAKTDLQRERIAMLNECKGDVVLAAARLGIDPQCIYDVMKRLRERGLLPAAPHGCPANRGLVHRRFSLGSLHATLPKQSLKVRRWVAQNVPEGGTVADLLWSVLLDVVEEEEDASG